MAFILRQVLAVLLVFLTTAAYAQSSDSVSENGSEDEVSEENLLTQAELENLVAPVALYPDTLLIQIFVAATNPLEVVKSNRLLEENEGADPEDVKAAVEAEEWDESVEVLATAFPDVIADMAEHIEWTETVGVAMLAQSDDVMAAVQTMRTQALNNGALASGEEQVVEVDEEEQVIIQPADPQVVYVPQYDPQVVYVKDNSTDAGDILMAGLITFGTIALIDDIFDDDDDWYGYWGCRNCGGWGGRPIYHNPRVDIDGNVNIGNKIDIDRNDLDIGPDGGWKPDDRRKKDARDKISNKRGEGGATRLPTNKGKTRSDELRGKLSKQSGAKDISRLSSGAAKSAVGKTHVPKKHKASAAGQKKSGIKKAPVKKSSVKKAPINKPSVKHSQQRSKPKATQKRASAGRTKQASRRGAHSGKKLKRR